MNSNNQASQPKTEDNTTKIIIAIISALALIIAGVIAYFAAIQQVQLPIEATQTAEAIHTSIALTTQANTDPKSTPSLFPTLMIEPTITPFVDATIAPEVFPPVILGIQTRKTGAAPNQIIFADISFRDADGDSYLVTYELVSTTVSSGLKYSDDQISISASRQIWGVVFPVQWDCNGQGYVAVFNVIILDSAGNQSEKHPVTFDCR